MKEKGELLQRRFAESLSFRQARIAVIAGFILGIVFSAIQISIDMRREVRQIDLTFEQSLRAVEDSAFQAAFGLDVVLAQTVVDGLFHQAAVVEAVIIDSFGDTMYSRSRPFLQNSLSWLAEGLFGQSKSFSTLLIEKGTGYHAGELSIHVDTNVIARSFFQRSGLILGFGILRNVLLAVILALLFHNMLTKPLRKIASLIHDGSKELYVSVEHENDELGEIAVEYNRLSRERTEVVAHLKEAERRYRRLFENSVVSLANADYSEVIKALNRIRGNGVIDLRHYLDANENAAWEIFAAIDILSVNGATLKLFDASSESQLIQEAGGTFNRKTIEMFKDQLCAIWDQHSTFSAETTFRTLTGNEIVSIISLPIPETEDGFRSIPVSIMDISDHRQLEDQLRQSQRMEAVGQLTGGVAHDFNNLLAVMLGNAELLEDMAGEDKEAKKFIETIKAAVDRASSLTGRLLAFSRQSTLAPVAADVGELISGLNDMLQRALGEVVELKFEDVEDLWPAMIDTHQFENALVNLALNARDAMPQGGILTIETANVALDEAYAKQHEEVTPGDYVQVVVSDTGTGIPPEVMAKVFEPFFTTKDVGKGSGLGLSMVFGFVKQSNGHITIYSEVGHGTSVKLYVPRSQGGPAETDVKDDVLVHALGSERILVVEDDPDVRKIPAAILRNQGYEVVEAENGEDATKRLKDGPFFDMLFTDIVLPGGMNGIEIANEAQKLQPSIKILYATGYSENANVQISRMAASSLLINKPYLRAELLEKVRYILESN